MHKHNSSFNRTLTKLVTILLQYGVKTKFHKITFYYKRKPSELLVLNVEMLIQTLFSIGIF